MYFEEKELQDVPVTGGSADLQKAFDQVQRQILYTLLAIAGFPPKVLDAYKRFHEALVF